MFEQRQPFIPHRMQSGRFFCSREELGAYLDDLLDFIDTNEYAVIFITDEGKPTLALMGVTEYERMRIQEQKLQKQLSQGEEESHEQ